MEAPDASEELLEEDAAIYGGEADDYSGDDTEADECITSILDRRTRRTAQGAHVEEVLVRRQGYPKPTWMDSGSLIEQGLLAPSLLRAFEKTLKAQQQSVAAQKAATIVQKPSASRSQEKKIKKVERVVQPTLPPPTHLPPKEADIKIHYPQKEADYDEEGLRAELQENAVLRQVFEKHLGANLSKATYTVKHGASLFQYFRSTHAVQ